MGFYEYEEPDLAEMPCNGTEGYAKLLRVASIDKTLIELSHQSRFANQREELFKATN